MEQLLLHNARVVLQHGTLRGGLLLRDGRIARVFTSEDGPTAVSDSESFDMGGSFLAPGMIDIHIHGSAGVDVQDADQNELAKLSEFLMEEGITGYFATLVPTDDQGYSSALAAIKSYIRPGNGRGARILGVHFEGPFVSRHRCGALKSEYFRTYDGDPRSVELFTESKEHLPGARLMTLAPEVEGGMGLARELTAKGMRAFIGHTEADPETLDRAVEAGARHITHFPNALEPLHHRRPGAVAWGLVQSDVTMDCIADFHHVHPLMLRLIYQTKGADRMALISDAILPTGVGDGVFTVWGEKIAVTGGRTALAEGLAAGTIAGSVITLREAFKNIISLGVPIHEAIRMASYVPARAAGVHHEYGSIEEGKRADLFAFDEDFRVSFAVIGGAVALDRR